MQTRNKALLGNGASAGSTRIARVAALRGARIAAAFFGPARIARIAAAFLSSARVAWITAAFLGPTRVAGGELNGSRSRFGHR